jgi:hypothetical protein
MHPNPTCYLNQEKNGVGMQIQGDLVRMGMHLQRFARHCTRTFGSY